MAKSIGLCAARWRKGVTVVLAPRCHRLFHLGAGCSRSPLPPSCTAVVSRTWTGHETLGEFEQAQHDYTDALDAARTMNDRVAEWQSAIDLGFLWAGRDYAQAETWFRQALVLSQALDDPTLHARSLNRIGNWHLNVEQPHEALRYHREALTIFQELQFYVPSLQKSPCFLHAISVLVHYDNAKRSGYNCNVSRGTIPDASSLLQQRAAGVPSPLRGREECRPHRRCLGGQCAPHTIPRMASVSSLDFLS